MRQEKVIIDTDIGNDIDDTLAVILAINSPEIDLLGITTVYSNTFARAQIAKHVLRKYGKESIPVVPGLREPLVLDATNPFFQLELIDELPRQYTDEMINEDVNTEYFGVEFLYETLSTSCDLITLIAIGPLTNIATLLIEHPEIKDKIKRIIVMGGAYFINQAEYNIICDPHAAKVVFDSGVEIIAVGLDVTTKCQLKQEHLEQIKKTNTAISDYLDQLIHTFMGYRNHTPYLHDPLAVAVAINPDVVNTQTLKVAVETEGHFTKGMTVNISNHKWWQKREDVPTIAVCESVKHDAVIEMVLKRILK